MVLGTNTNASKKKAAHKQPASSIVQAARRPTTRPGFGSGKSSSSRFVGHNFVSTNSFGHRTMRQEVLHRTALKARQQADQVEYQQNNDSITISERTQLARIRADEDQNYSNDQEDSSLVDIHDILTGDAAADLSHIGGEFAELLAVEEGLLGPVSR
jgi:ATP-dependent exoDNAse (exonuclease V) alpha subunit